MNNRYLIKDTTRDERQKLVNGAIVISMLDSPAPSQKAIELYQKYVDGEIEIDEVSNEIIKNYREYID